MMDTANTPELPEITSRIKQLKEEIASIDKDIDNKIQLKFPLESEIYLLKYKKAKIEKLFSTGTWKYKGTYHSLYGDERNFKELFKLFQTDFHCYIEFNTIQDGLSKIVFSDSEVYLFFNEIKDFKLFINTHNLQLNKSELDMSIAAARTEILQLEEISKQIDNLLNQSED